MGERTRRLAQRALPAAAVAAACLSATALALPAHVGAAKPGGGGPRGAPPVDVRKGGPPREAPARVKAAREALRKRFGPTLVLGTERASGATRVVQRLDGALTGPASGDRAGVARGWLRDNRDVLGLDAAGVEELEVAERRTAGPAGLTSVRFGRRFRGVPVFDGDVRVVLDRGGRVLAALGSPVADPAVGSVVPRLDAAAARRALARGVGPTTPAAPAELTIFPAPAGPQLAWRLIERRSSTATYAAVVDATSGDLLLRQNLTVAAAPATAYPSYPRLGAATAEAVDLEAKGWLPAGADRLEGPYVRAFSDVDDDDVADGPEEITRKLGGFARAFLSAGGCAASALAPGALCTWTPSAPGTWLANREQNGVQAFVLANRFRDHLERAPIAFGADGFAGADRVVVQTRDGAAEFDDASSGPDEEHLNNANITVPPDGTSPTLQTYLFAGPDYRAIEAGDDAATVWHEYAHGLSLRLITHSDGTGALASPHGAALGEGWSDFLALDLLHRERLEVDDPAVQGEVDIGAYSDARRHVTRWQGADCAVGAPAPACPGGFRGPRGAPASGTGGFTLADFGRVADGPQVHADGEIWLEVLWDLRRALIEHTRSEEAGSDAVEELVADGMRLTPPEPSFLEARNAILAAETAHGGTHRDLLWEVFAARGMGFGATAEDAEDTGLTDDFSLPPGPDDPPVRPRAEPPRPEEPTTTTATVALAPPAPPATTPTATQPPLLPPPPLPARGLPSAPVLRIAATGRRAADASVRCSSRCTARLTGTLSAAMARRLGLRRRTVLTATRTLRAPTSLRLRLPTAVLRAAKRRGVRVVRVTVDVSATDLAKRSTRTRRTVRVTL